LMTQALIYKKTSQDAHRYFALNLLIASAFQAL
jgi:hypothetical protein